MARTRDFLAIDLGASGGRVLSGRWDGERFGLSEIHRFPNLPVSQMGRLQWDALAIWSEVKSGLARYAAGQADRARGELAGLGLDTWGVDFASAGSSRQPSRQPLPLPRPPHRGGDGAGVRARAQARRLHGDRRAADALQHALPAAGDGSRRRPADRRRRDHAQHAQSVRLLAVRPDESAERTHATTTQCLDARTRGWAFGLLDALGIPTRIFPDLVEPGTPLGPISPDVTAETGISTCPRVRRGLPRHRQRGGRDTRPRRRERLHQQRHLEPDGGRASRAHHHRRRARGRLHERGRRRTERRGCCGTSPACGWSPSAAASGSETAMTMAGTSWWP